MITDRLMDEVFLVEQIAGEITNLRLRDREAREKVTVSEAEVDAYLARRGVIGATERPLVSTDLRARPESIVMACPETRVTPQGLLRVFGWYDNEWGFSTRMLDMARLMGRESR